MAARISLTKKQRQTAIGAELLALCQTITSDGSLSPEEVLKVRDWLVEHKDSNLPAVQHLIDVVTRIIADRRVTLEERRELFIALETVLPPELRAVANAARRTGEERREEALRLGQMRERHKEKDERTRNTRIGHWDFMVAGCTYDGRGEVIRRFVRDGESAFLRRDVHNRYSSHAVEVLTPHGYQIGYVPEENAEEVAPLLDDGHPYTAKIKKVLTGSRSPIPVLIADIYRKDCTVEGVVRPENNVANIPPPTFAQPKSFTVYVIAAILVVVLVIVVLLK